MKRKFNYQINQSHNVSVEADVPDDCPVCGRLIIFNHVASSFAENKKQVQLVLKCNNVECNSFLILWFDVGINSQLTLAKVEPPILPPENISQHIKDISPDFISIYQEAREAKERNLLQIAGPGYRKAFEFLIKDYAKSISDPAKHGDIEKLFAGNVVSQFISHTRIQAAAKRALWLGNDETHYLRKWVNQDINDLITLIELTLHWVEIEHQSKTYDDKMPE